MIYVSAARPSSLLCALVLLVAAAEGAHAATTVRLAEMTWPEVEAALKGGVDTVLVPFGGTEQGGPHLILGKHNHVVAAAAAAAARRLGRTLVAPVVPFAPAGGYAPADGHMRFPGTVSLRPATYVSIAADIALSLKAHGVKIIVLMADHGEGQDALAQLAAQLDEVWRPSGTRVLHVAAYHGANGQADLLRRRGHSDPAIGNHAGIADTAELMQVHPDGVRRERLPAAAADPGQGSDGEPWKATADLGAEMLALKVKTIVEAVEAIREQMR